MISYDQYYVNGRFHAIVGERSVEVLDPTYLQPCARVQLCEPVAVDQALTAARTALPQWSQSSLEQRVGILKRLREELDLRRQRIVASLAQEMGCPVWLGELMQMPMALRGLDCAIEGLAQIRWTEAVGNGLVERVPCGVVAAITPWNFPVHQMVAKVAPAIAAGCTVVLKPSEYAPGAALAFIEAVDAAGVPAGVVNLVWGDGELGRYLVEHAEVDHISFTGSTSVGRHIMTSAARRLTPLTLELGGKSAAVLLEDADLDAAMPVVVRMALANSGQTCVSQSRILAPRRLAGEVMERFLAQLEQWPLGDPRDPATRLGPVANRRQYEHVTRMMEQAMTAGAQPLKGAQEQQWSENGYFVEPVLFTKVSPEMPIAREEVFGPVLSLLLYDTEEEAVRLVNEPAYGLSGAVWSRDDERALRLARQMRTGQVILNGAAQNLATPFGGWGLSGFGRENGRFGIEDLLRFRSLHGAA